MKYIYIYMRMYSIYIHLDYQFHVILYSFDKRSLLEHIELRHMFKLAPFWPIQ